MHLGEVDVEEADWIALEARALGLGLGAIHLGQLGDAVMLQ